MRAAIRSSVSHRRNSSITTVPPPRYSEDYSSEHASIAASILYRSPIPSQSGLPIYILNAAAFPDAFEVDYNTLLGYVLDRLPGEEELIAGEDYEVIFFAGGQPDSATSEKRAGPGNMWYLQAYQILSRAVRKRLHKLYVVHERSWVRVLIEIFSTIVSPKFKKKIVHVNTLSGLALHLPIEQLLIPPSVYLQDRRLAQDIYAPYVSGRRAFAADESLPRNSRGERRLPRVLRETTTFVCLGDNLDTEGLFRIPPHSQLLSILREAYDRAQNFIVWKEGSLIWSPGMDDSMLSEIQQVDTYSVYLAAGLIKLWYRELNTPIFEESCYQEMKIRFGDIYHDFTVEDLADVFSPTSTRSFLSPTARIIATLHLLPLLSTVAEHEAANKMPAENLAICFAPALLHGSDQLTDAKMTSIIRRILEASIEMWSDGLREACNTTAEAFSVALRDPKDPQDYEDPLHEINGRPSGEGITLQDNDVDSSRPPLPPRPSKSVHARQESASSVKRKPAPTAVAAPRYSTIMATDSPTMGSPFDMSKNVDLLSSTEPEAEPAPAYSAPVNDISAARKRSQVDFVKELKMSIAADSSASRRISSPLVSPPSPIQESPEKVKDQQQQRSVSSDDRPTFAKPTWAASSRPGSAPGSGRMVPQIQIPSDSVGAPSASGSLSAPAFKVRTPSPGLLKRMASIEAIKTMEEEKEKQRENAKLLPRRLPLKKASVDDLKRLYEDKTGMVEGLNLGATGSRRSSNVSLVESRRGSNVS